MLHVSQLISITAVYSVLLSQACNEIKNLELCLEKPFLDESEHLSSQITVHKPLFAENIVKQLSFQDHNF